MRVCPVAVAELAVVVEAARPDATPALQRHPAHRRAPVCAGAAGPERISRVPVGGAGLEPVLSGKYSSIVSTICLVFGRGTQC